MPRIRENWFAIIPQVARPPQSKQGRVVIVFVILKSGKIKEIHLDTTSGDKVLDRAAFGGVSVSNPFDPLPASYKAAELELKVNFCYNPAKPDSGAPLVPSETDAKDKK
ncbi:MAG: TonB family protein [Acidobacteriales bacterium]|nr:TonB family protein [Terriglobales bacterium]